MQTENMNRGINFDADGGSRFGLAAVAAFMRLAAIYRIVIATGSHLGSCAANWCLLPEGAILALEQESEVPL